MAIYKLGAIARLKSGSTPSRNNKEFWESPNAKWLTSGEVEPNVIYTKEQINITKFSKNVFRKGSPIMAMYGATAGRVGYLGDDMYVNQAICVFEPNENVILEKYLYFWLELSSAKISNLAVGGAQQNLSLKTISDVTIDLPHLKVQQQIIDIIEPIENQIQLLNKYLLKVEVSGKLLSRECSKVEKMIENCVFEKGKNHDGSTGKVPFLNVSAANGKINNYCDSVPNIQIGDVMLSLDGNTGLVNNFLDGFNGYLYKVWSQKFKNFEIYYSLKSEENQSIIKLNETGTTIKHSPNSKKELKFFSFINRDALEQLFNFEILLKKQIVSFEKCKAQLIHLLIK